MQQAIGGVMKMIGGPSGAASAPGAAATVGFRTDTTLKGPWDHAALSTAPSSWPFATTRSWA